MKKITWTILFASAMGLLEAVVVIYLRLLYYPQGFNFPLVYMPPQVGLIEICREAATVVMLAGIGILAGNSRLERFAYFVLAFAVWDLFYYVFLFVFIGWPASIFTWDVLFLIPLPWIGPVWAPCLAALLMLAGSLRIILQIQARGSFKISRTQWVLMLTGVLICIVSFLLDFIRHAGAGDSLLAMLEADNALNLISTYTPQHFNHLVFFTGFACMTGSLITAIYQNKKQHEK